ncbi:MAG TPA: S9 family peptidase [Bacteroidales bacterium]|nr:S9 family peptidase [Bacteroidales bacterium]HPT01855.1 S9 family peptidase [Bacteroidales bacterium]
MKTFPSIFAGLVLLGACQSNNSLKKAYQWPDVPAPVCEKKATELVAHGDTRIDNYYWLNDYFRKGPDSSKVVKYLEAENAYLDTMMSGTKAFREKLYNEMKARIKEKDEIVPVFKNGYYYYTRMVEGKEYFLYCRKKGNLEAREEILLDVNRMAEGLEYFAVSGLSVSPDNNLLAYGVDKVSRRQYAIYVKNLTTGVTTLEIATGTNGNPVWAADNKTLFYVKNNPETLLSEKILRHTVGSPQAGDAVVYTEKDPSNYITVWKSKSDKYIFISSEATMSSETRFIAADSPASPFAVFQPRMKDVLYSVEFVNGKFVILTNLDALNFRLMETYPEKTGRESWKEIIAHRPDVLIEGFEPFKGFMVVTERQDGLINFRVMDLVNRKEHYVKFDEPAYLASSDANAEYTSRVFRYNYTSLTTPRTVYDYSMTDKSKKMMKQQEVLGDFKPENYVTERLMAKASDGTEVPVSLVYRKGFRKNGKSPLLLYGYGSYGYSQDATFSSSRLSLLDRGFVYAIAHVRGGQEKGRQWYEDGKMHKKMNTFTDFIACAEYLIHQKYTSPDHLYAMGGSAGGLLMGAVVNLRPDLWKGIIAQVPFVDVVTTMSDPTIPLTTNEYDEWGNPAVKADYDAMKSYSPYDNVEKKAYPNMLVTTGLHDSQVQYFEPAKWVAKLRGMKTDKNILLLKTNMETGHGGASGRFKYLKDIALEDAFLFALEGITE